MDKLLSIGLDVGTTTTQLILSELAVENKGNAFSVPEMVIDSRTLLYQSPVLFTPLLSGELVDGDAIAHWVQTQYEAAGIRKTQVDTGAVIITGETSRKENARQVLTALSGFAGEFVVATAGPDLESVLAAKGAGAVEYSAQTGKTVLHMDIGGGTSNLAFIENGKITRTGCLNVGGRLVKFDADGTVIYLSPVLQTLSCLQVGQIPTQTQLSQTLQLLVQALQMAAGLLSPTVLLDALTTRENTSIWHPKQPDVISFSGGVADCIESNYPPFAYGDLGVLLGKAIRESSLCRMDYRLGDQTIRATVIGAGCHSAQLSGSTVFHRNIRFPLKNLPVVKISDLTQMPSAWERREGTVALTLEQKPGITYREIRKVAENLALKLPNPAILCMKQDMAKALGQALAIRMPPDAALLCIDRVAATEGSYLDIGAPVGNAMPVVVKTLVLEREDRRCL